MYIVQDEKKPTFVIFLLVIGMAFVVLSFGRVYAQDVRAEITRVGDATHLEFQGRAEWNYDVQKNNKNQVTLLVPALDDKTILTLQTWSCPFIKEIKVNKNGPDGRSEVLVTLAAEDVESFDYQTDMPSNLVFDFYKQSSPEPAKAQELPVAKPVVATEPKKVAAAPTNKLPEKIYSNEYQKVERSPAGSETLAVEPPSNGIQKSAKTESTDGIDMQYARGVFDGADPEYKRFRLKNYQVKEEAVIASRQNIYLEFPMLHLKSNRFAELMEESPIYEILPEENQENKEARLLHTLFKNERWASFLETFNYYIKKYPNSKYDEIVRNMSAEVHIKLYKRDNNPFNYEQFQSIYKYLNETYPDSPLQERNKLLLAYSSLEKGEVLESLRELQNFMKTHPKSEERENLQLSVAESLVGLKKFDDALAIYSELQKNARDKKYSVEATFREADIYFLKKDFNKALSTYREALKKHGNYAQQYPNAQYNISESLFWTGQYKEGLESYIQFLSQFPAHEYCGFALTRIGELLQIMGADQTQYMGAFLESYFRYPASQGADVARIRMLAQGLKTMKEREKKRAIDEIDAITEKSSLPRFAEFSNLMKAEGLTGRGEYDESLKLLVKYFQDNPTTANINIFRSRILRNVANVMREDIRQNNYMDALEFHNQYKKTWLKKSDRIDTNYFLAQAYEKAGVLKEADKIYNQVLAGLKSISGKKEEKERKVNEHLPTQDQVQLRLAQIANAQRLDQKAFQHLRQVKGQLSNEEQHEKVRLSSAVAENLGDYKGALTQLEVLVNSSKKDGTEDVLLLPTYLKISQLALRLKNYDVADGYLKKIEDMKNGGININDETWAAALELRGDLQADRGEKIAAVETYTKLLEAFETSRPLSGIRFKTGKLLFDEGDLKGAEKIWSGFSGTTGEYYKRLAQEKLAQADWQDTYKKYIDRIPAAEGLK